MVSALFPPEDTVIFVTRASLIEDGQLRDVTKMASEAGIKWPVALTSAAWEKFVAWSDEDNEKQHCQDEDGRLWDVLYMCRIAMRGSKTKGPTMNFPFICLMRDGVSVEPKEVEAKVTLSGGDNGEPVLTIMTVDEVD